MHRAECSEPSSRLSIPEAVTGCLAAERERQLMPRSLGELQRYLAELERYCRERDRTTVDRLTPSLLKDYVLWRCRDSPSLVKAVVWSLRKLGGYLALRGAVASNPASALRQPKVSPRARLPEHLSESQLRQLLATAARNRPGRDLVILALLASTGLRPHEVVGLQRQDIHLGLFQIDAKVKGGWRKPTPLSASMTALLGNYLESRDDDCQAAFLSPRRRPVSVSWLQRMVRQAGAEAGLPLRVTPRVLRHTFATHAADRHGKAVTKALLGHRRLKTTDIYTHLSPRRFKAVMQRHPYHAAVLCAGGDRE